MTVLQSEFYEKIIWYMQKNNGELDNYSTSPTMFGLSSFNNSDLDREEQLKQERTYQSLTGS